MVNSAKYMEVGLKMLTHVQRKTTKDLTYSMNRQLQDLFLLLYSGLRYLQENHTALKISSQYGLRTQMIYKNLARNTSSLVSKVVPIHYRGMTIYSCPGLVAMEMEIV